MKLIGVERIYPLWSIEHWCYTHHLTGISIIIRFLIRVFFSADIPYKCCIGKGTIFPHDALGTIIHPDTVIGMNCKILHGVTFGGRGGGESWSSAGREQCCHRCTCHIIR